MSISILVAEHPWYSPKKNPRQASSFPFLEGVAKFINVNCYYATFFEKESFDSALKHLTAAGESEYILYVGGHGDGDSVGNVSIADIARSIANNGKKIKGLVLSSCHGGLCDDIQMALGWGVSDALQLVNGPNWIFTYKYEAGWMLSALIEQSVIFEAASHLSESKTLNSVDRIERMFVNSLSPFNPEEKFNSHGDKVADSFRVFCRPQGSGTVREITDQIKEKLNWK